MARPKKEMGIKLAVYVPSEDAHIVDKIRSLEDQHRKEGYRTSVSFETIRLVKLGLQHKDAEKI